MISFAKPGNVESKNRIKESLKNLCIFLIYKWNYPCVNDLKLPAKTTKEL